MTDTLTIRDNRTGREYEVPIADGTIRAADLKQIAVDGEPGLATYDPGFVNTASCRSAVTYIDGDAGILEYRGYPIEQLAEHSTFLEVAYLLLNGELPTSAELEQWTHDITYHTFLHENVKQLIEGGIIYGIAGATGNPITFDRGIANVRSLGALGLPRLADSPEITVEILTSEDEPGGVTELAVPIVAPAIANAVFASTGQRLRSLPLVMGSA